MGIGEKVDAIYIIGCIGSQTKVQDISLEIE